MKQKLDFTGISMIGRFAYAAMCAERYALAKYPNKDWRRLFGWMWQATSEYFDDWYYRFGDILPEFLYEFDYYKPDAFSYLSKEDYDYYSVFLKDIDQNMARLITIPAEISMVYAYSKVPGVGQESIDLVEEAIGILEENKIELPDINKIKFCDFSKRYGYGESFDGTRLSIILNK